MSDDLRRHPRFRVALRVHLGLPSGIVITQTISVSREGISVRLAPPPPVGEEVPLTLELPSGTSIDGRASTRNNLPNGLVGMSLSFEGEALNAWEAFVDEEESTGSLWRMIGRVARAPDDVNAPRGLAERVDAVDYKFHTVGENGEAYRIAFSRHSSTPPEASGVPAALQPQLVRVLSEPLLLQLDERSRVQRVRVAELSRGGYGCIPLDEGATATVVALCVGELLVVMEGGKSVFPHLTDLELEQVACDTFKREMARPMFTPTRGTRKPAPVTLPPLPKGAIPKKFREGFDAVRFAQAAAEDVQVRRYGARDIFFHPSVWAKVTREGTTWMGPTIQDGPRVCVLALVGPGAPRVVRIEEDAVVSVLKPPGGM